MATAIAAAKVGTRKISVEIVDFDMTEREWTCGGNRRAVSAVHIGHIINKIRRGLCGATIGAA